MSDFLSFKLSARLWGVCRDVLPPNRLWCMPPMHMQRGLLTPQQKGLFTQGLLTPQPKDELGGTKAFLGVTLGNTIPMEN